MADRQVPEWVKEEIAKWQGILRLDGWEIKPSVKQFDGCPVAYAKVLPDVWMVEIVFDENVPDTIEGDIEGEWRKTIIHELVHVLTARIHYFVEDDVLTQLSPQARDIAVAMFRRELEPVVERVARVLYEINEGKA